MNNYDRASAIIRFTTCNHCGVTMPQLLALTKHYFGQEEHFCSEECYTEEFINTVRKLEGEVNA